MGRSGGGTERKFQFDWRNTYFGEPDAETRRQWVLQMGTPYPHGHVMRLFREAREKHEKYERRMAETTSEPTTTHTKKPKARKHKKRRPNPSDGEGTTKAQAQDEAIAAATTTTTTATTPAPESVAHASKVLKQTRIDCMFQPPPRADP